MAAETPDDTVYSMEGDRLAFLAARDSGRRIKVDEETFYYFLEVLPPASMRRTYRLDGEDVRTSFGFAEGCEEITAFWKADGHYWCQKTGIINTGF